MLKDFNKDLEIGKKAEKIVFDTFTSLTSGYTFKDVSDIREYRYKGDIIATSASGEEYFIEVKNDSRIAETKNILCEEDNYIKEGGYFLKGNMYCDSDIFCVVSEQLRKIYVFDFKALQAIYKKGEFKEINHSQQTTYCYLLPMYMAKKYGAYITEIDY